MPGIETAVAFFNLNMFWSSIVHLDFYFLAFQDGIQVQCLNSSIKWMCEREVPVPLYLQCVMGGGVCHEEEQGRDKFT